MEGKNEVNAFAGNPDKNTTREYYGGVLATPLLLPTVADARRVTGRDPARRSALRPKPSG